MPRPPPTPPQPVEVLIPQEERSAGHEQYETTQYTDPRGDIPPRRCIAAASFEGGEEKRETIVAQADRQAREVHRLRDDLRRQEPRSPTSLKPPEIAEFSTPEAAAMIKTADGASTKPMGSYQQYKIPLNSYPSPPPSLAGATWNRNVQSNPQWNQEFGPRT